MPTAETVGQSLAAALATRVQGDRSASQAAHSDSLIDLSREYGRGVVPERILQAVDRSLAQGHTHYTTRPGLPELAQAVALKLAGEQGMSLDPAHEVVITCGGREGLFVALQALVRPSDEVLVPALRPAFYGEAIALAQGVAVAVPLPAAEGFELRAERIRAGLTAKSRLLLLPTPANPTGVAVSAAEMGRIADLVAEHDLTVISDETLDESLAGDVRHTSIASLPGAAPRTLVVGSFSRLYNLAAWRVGYFAGPRSLVQPARELKQAMTICTSAMSQFAALEALTGPQDWLVQRRAEIDAKRAFVLAALDQMGLPHSSPQATPYLWIDVARSGLDSDTLARRLLAQTGVAVTPGTLFGPQGRDYVRLSLWAPFSELEQAMDRLRSAFETGLGGER